MSAAALLLALATSPAGATKAKYVLEQMSGQEQIRYLGGAVEMAARLFSRNGKHAKGQCAIRWFFQTPGAVTEVIGVFSNYQDRDASALLEVLIHRHCGD